MLLRRASTNICDQSSGWTTGRLVAVCVIRDAEKQGGGGGKVDNPRATAAVIGLWAYFGVGNLGVGQVLIAWISGEAEVSNGLGIERPGKVRVVLVADINSDHNASDDNSCRIARVRSSSRCKRIASL